MNYTKQDEKYYYDFIYEIYNNNYEINNYIEDTFLFKIDKIKNTKSFNLCRDVKNRSGSFLKVKNHIIFTDIGISNQFKGSLFKFTSDAKFYVFIDKEKVKEAIYRSEKSIILKNIKIQEKESKKRRL